MKTAYLDAFSGLSGDMIVGAIIDCGADFGELERAIKSMPIAGYRLSTRRKTLSGISALKFDVAVTEPQPERHFGEIRALIDASPLATTIKKRAISIFEVLAQAEAKIHNTTPDQVHFHEVGAVDSIIDIVGTAWGLEHLGVGDVTRLSAADGQRIRALAAWRHSGARAGDGRVAVRLPAENRRRRA